MSRRNPRNDPRNNSIRKNSRLQSQASRIENRISRMNAPISTKDEEIGGFSGMFFFENQNENKVIDVKIG